MEDLTELQQGDIFRWSNGESPIQVLKVFKGLLYYRNLYTEDYSKIGLDVKKLQFEILVRKSDLQKKVLSF